MKIICYEYLYIYIGMIQTTDLIIVLMDSAGFCF